MSDFPHFVTWCKMVEDRLEKAGMSEEQVEELVRQRYSELSSLHARGVSADVAAKKLGASAMNRYLSNPRSPSDVSGDRRRRRRIEQLKNTRHFKFVYKGGGYGLISAPNLNAAERKLRALNVNYLYRSIEEISYEQMRAWLCDGDQWDLDDCSRANPIGVYGANDGAAGGFVNQHPYLTTLIAVCALSVIVSIATGGKA